MKRKPLLCIVPNEKVTNADLHHVNHWVVNLNNPKLRSHYHTLTWRKDEFNIDEYIRNLRIGDTQVEQLDAVSAWSDKYVYQDNYSETWRSEFKLNQQKRKLKRKWNGWNDANLKLDGAQSQGVKRSWAYKPRLKQPPPENSVGTY